MSVMSSRPNASAFEFSNKRNFRHGFTEAYPDRILLLRILLRIGDCVCILFSGIVSCYIYLYRFKEIRLELVEPYIPAVTFGVVLAAIAFQLTRVYDVTNLVRYWISIRQYVAGLAIVISCLIILGFIPKMLADYSRAWLIIWFGLSVVLLAGLRWAVVSIFKNWETTGAERLKVVIVGACGSGIRVGTALANEENSQLKVLGYFDNDCCQIENRLPSTLSCLGRLNDLVTYGRFHDLDMVVLALPWSADRTINELIDTLKPLPVDIVLAPEGIGLNLSHTKYYFASGVGLLVLREKSISGYNAIAKQVEDKILASAALLFLFPIMIIIAILIKFDSPGPVLFRQPRPGFNQKTFEIYKFRTMYIEHCDPEIRGGLIQRGDMRVTRIGRFLRKTSLDELPQFFNVLLGDMSVVGPRPHAAQAKVGEKYYDEVVQDYAQRHCVKPGITGLAQINGWRGETRHEAQILNRIRNDIYYIENWTMLLDLKIILKTFYVILRMENAY